MAKINKFIAAYSDAISEAGIDLNCDIPPKKVIHRFVRIFKNIDDERCSGMVEYPLVEIILIAFLAVLGNASTWIEIEQFGRAKKKWLKKFIRLENGVPSHDTFRRVFSLIDSQQLQRATVDFLVENIAAIKKSLPKSETEEYRQLCIDGKEKRGSGRKYNTSEEIKNLQTLHIFDASNEICIRSEAISEKTNEIPVAQKLLENMQLKGCIVTFDALHMQKNTVSVIKKSKGHYIGGLKGNQAGLLEEAAAYFDEETLNDIRNKGSDFTESLDKAHGKIERRYYYLVRPPKRDIVAKWDGLKAFVCCIKKSQNVKTSEITTDTHYYASSIDDIELCSQAIRGHWSVENNLHWHLDYSLGEDENTTIDKTAFNNLSLINKMVLSLCKLTRPLMKKGTSIRSMRKMYGWNIEKYLSALLTCFDTDSIVNAMMSSASK